MGPADYTRADLDPTEPTIRPASRVLLVDSEDRLLLMRFDPNKTGLGVWITPGGGLEPGETFEQGAIRELWEETGLHILDEDLGPCVWLRAHRFYFDERLFEQQEHFFVCRVETFDLGDHLNHDEKEREEITEVRWWRIEEIEAASDQRFGPRDLARLLRPVLRGEIPAEPVIVGR